MSEESQWSDEFAQFMGSQKGAASMRAPGNDNEGAKAVEIMKNVNQESSVDMIELGESQYKITLAGGPTQMLILGLGSQ